MSFNVLLQDEHNNQALIRLFKSPMGKVKLGCSYLWNCKAPGAFKLPSSITIDTDLWTDQYNFSFFSSTNEELVFYYYTDTGDRVDLFTLWDMYSWCDTWKDKGEGVIHWVGAARLRSGLCTWEKLNLNW